MDQLQIAELVEKYLKGELNQEEKTMFEQLRSSDPEVDQSVVEYHFFMEEMERYGQVRRFKSNLYDTHHTLQENGEIKDLQLKTSAKIINLWSKYRRVCSGCFHCRYYCFVHQWHGFSFFAQCSYP